MEDTQRVGTIVGFSKIAHKEPPVVDGLLLCDGREVSIEQYPRLFECLQYRFGAGSQRGYFRLPDLRDSEYPFWMYVET
jgi:microcystin-dependent protein